MSAERKKVLDNTKTTMKYNNGNVNGNRDRKKKQKKTTQKERERMAPGEKKTKRNGVRYNKVQHARLFLIIYIAWYLYCFQGGINNFFLSLNFFF